MAEQFHHPPDLLNLLIDTIPLLCKSKKDVLLFFRGAGVDPDDQAEVAAKLEADPSNTNKYEIARSVLTKVTARGDSGLRPRREIIKRVTEFENFSSCWASDQLKARGLVASVREVVNVKDSFTRMKQERDAEKEREASRQRAAQIAIAEKRRKIEEVSRRLGALFGMEDKPQVRGKLLEGVLNDLFRAFGILGREDFQRREPDSPVVLEQIDGIIELEGTIHLVEMKWLKNPVGVAEFGQHLVRVFGRANASGIFISTSGFTAPVVTQCTTCSVRFRRS
jgi:restriction endonuclease Mrr